MSSNQSKDLFLSTCAAGAHLETIAQSPAVQVLFNRISFQQVLCEFDLKPKAGKKNITLQNQF